MLSQSAGYTANALGTLAGAGGKPLLVKELAEACEIPPAYLAKIINTLAKKGLVSTQRGIGGGVTLTRDPRQITLFDICEALDDPITESRCFLGTAECSDERACPAHRFWKAERARQVEFLKQTTVADVAAFEMRRRVSRSRESGRHGGSP